MEQLIATPVKPPELVLGKLIPYFLIGYLDMAITVVMAMFLFEVPLRGNVALLAVISAVFLFGGLGLGILISIVTKSQLVASQISMVATFLPAFLLSGFMFAISNMPPVAPDGHADRPGAIFCRHAQGLLPEGQPFTDPVADAVFLLVFGIITFVAQTGSLKRK